MKNKKRIFLGIILALLGLSLIFNDKLVELMVKINISRTMDKYEELDLNTSDKSNVDYDFSLIDDIELTKTYIDLSEEDYKNIIGKLIIPDVDIHVVLFEGISKEKLLKGVSTMKADQIMGQGNYSIAGHYGINNELFHNLLELEEGSEIYLIDANKQYVYEAVDREVVEPDRIDMISDTRLDKYDKPIISLMSCYYVDGKNTGKRIFITGELKEVREI